MAFTLYETSAPAFVNSLGNMRTWIEKADEGLLPSQLVSARLTDDMRPLSAQYQMACDSAKNAMARLAGIEPPVMTDTESTIAELQERCDRTISFIQSIDPETVNASVEREVVLQVPNGPGYRFTGADYLRRFALPNFYFHVSIAYGIMRAHGVPLGKSDYLQHLGPPNAG